MTTDPIADMLVRLQNASMVGKTRVSMPRSQIKLAIADILCREGYIGEVDKKSKDINFTVTLVYKNNRPGVTGFKRISKPSRRMYLGVRDVKPVKRGHGLLVLSTPAGILTGKEALTQRVGGEALFEIW
jgi:small subunit ribosomal protein S8